MEELYRTLSKETVDNCVNRLNDLGINCYSDYNAYTEDKAVYIRCQGHDMEISIDEIKYQASLWEQSQAD